VRNPPNPPPSAPAVPAEEQRPRTPPPRSAPGHPPPLPARALKPEGPPPSARDLGPTWLDRGPLATSAYGAQGGAAQAVAPRDGARALDEVAEALLENTAVWLQRFAKTPDPRAFAQMAQRLEPTLRSLSARGATRALWAVSSTLHGIAMEGTQVAGSRAHVAMTLLRVFEDPTVLASVAEHLLTGNEESREHAKRLLVHAGVAGAYGLYGARVKLANEQAIRAVFTAVLKDFGAKAWPVVRAALEKIIASDQSQNPRTMELAEDLLLSVPAVGDESAGHIVVKYLRVNVAGVCRAATAAIVQLWGERAKPLLVGMLQSKDDVVRIAGIAGLRQLKGIDEHIIPRLQAILLRRLPAGEELRAAAALALSHAAPSAVPPAISLLAQLLATSRDGSEPRLQAASSDGGITRGHAVTLAVARSLLMLAGKTHRGLVAERAERSPEPLRSHMRKLLTG
jgi:serine/threonine-protein kinase